MLALAAALVLAAVAPLRTPTGWVTDRLGLLTTATQHELAAHLEAYEHTTGHQLLVYIDRTTGGVPLEEVAASSFGAWRVGRAGLDDGLVLFIFSDDRRARIEVGYGLEDRVPDAIASRVVREQLLPRLAAGEPDLGVREAVTALIAAIGSGPPAPPSMTQLIARHPRAIIVSALLGLAFLVLLILRPGLALRLLYLMTLFRGNGRGGGRGWRGGGGRSGGAGASGRW